MEYGQRLAEERRHQGGDIMSSSLEVRGRTVHAGFPWPQDACVTPTRLFAASDDLPTQSSAQSYQRGGLLCIRTGRSIQTIPLP